MTIPDILYCLTLLTLFTVIALCAWYEKKAKIVPAPTLPWVRRTIIVALEKYLQPGGAPVIAELGSGWGGVVFGLARKFPAADVHGYEISPLPYYYSKLCLALSRRKNVKLYKDSFFDTNLGGYDAFICYLSPHLMGELRPKFEAELKAGALIISNAFAIPDWTPVEILHSKGPLKIPVYVYRKN